MRWGRRPSLLSEWHRWFAWHPVTMCDGTKVWLESIMRRATYHFDGLGHTREWHYDDVESA